MGEMGDWLPSGDAVSRRVHVGGGHMHYVAAGEGEPVVFLHGNPTSSYLWRRVIPRVATQARCIAPDLMGMGCSDPPRTGHRFDDHYTYLRAFIDALGLETVTFVGHDWGGSLAFRYLSERPEQVRGLAFMEVMLEALTWAEMPLDFRFGFRLMRTPGVGWLMLSVANLFVNAVLPMATKRRLPAATMRRYRASYPSVASRRAVRQWPCEVPLDGRPADNAATFAAYAQALQQSRIPKLLCYASPGAVIGQRRRQWAEANLPNLTSAYMGEGIHVLPEEHPEAIGDAVASWYQTRVAATDGRDQGS